MNVNNIIVKNRIRKDLGDITLLKESIQTYGLLHPIIVDDKNHLISGERRLIAVKELGWEEVDVIVKNTPYKDAISIEIIENTTRKDFTQKELLDGIKQRRLAHSNNMFLKIALFFQRIWQKLFPYSK